MSCQTLRDPLDRHLPLRGIPVSVLWDHWAGDSMWLQLLQHLGLSCATQGAVISTSKTACSEEGRNTAMKEERCPVRGLALLLTGCHQGNKMPACWASLTVESSFPLIPFCAKQCDFMKWLRWSSSDISNTFPICYYWGNLTEQQIYNNYNFLIFSFVSAVLQNL